MLVSTGYGTGAALALVKRNAADHWTAEPHWRRGDLKTKFTSPVLHEGHAYGHSKHAAS